MKTNSYQITQFEVYVSGDLKGYAEGQICFFENNRVHDFLYRIHDPDNGPDNTLVSIDYGYENPMVKKLWGEISSNIKLLVGGTI